MNSECECSICLDMDKKEEEYTTICKHTFHKECLQKWLKQSTLCPMCKSHIPANQKLPGYTALPILRLNEMSNIPVVDYPHEPRLFHRLFTDEIPRYLNGASIDQSSNSQVSSTTINPHLLNSHGITRQAENTGNNQEDSVLNTNFNIISNADFLRSTQQDEDVVDYVDDINRYNVPFTHDLYFNDEMNEEIIITQEGVENMENIYAERHTQNIRPSNTVLMVTEDRNNTEYLSHQSNVMDAVDNINEYMRITWRLGQNEEGRMPHEYICHRIPHEYIWQRRVDVLSTSSPLTQPSRSTNILRQFREELRFFSENIPLQTQAIDRSVRRLTHSSHFQITPLSESIEVTSYSLDEDTREKLHSIYNFLNNEQAIIEYEDNLPKLSLNRMNRKNSISIKNYRMNFKKCTKRNKDIMLKGEGTDEFQLKKNSIRYNVTPKRTHTCQRTVYSGFY